MYGPGWEIESPVYPKGGQQRYISTRSKTRKFRFIPFTRENQSRVKSKPGLFEQTNMNKNLLFCQSLVCHPRCSD